MSSEGHLCVWSDGAQTLSLQEGHQLLSPPGDLNLPRLMRTGDLPVLQSPGPRLARKSSAGCLSMSQSNPCSPWMQCWLLGPSLGLMGTGGVRVVWEGSPQWPRLCGWGDNGGTLQRQQQPLERSWRGWRGAETNMTGLGGTDGKEQQALVLCLWRGSGLEHQQGRGTWLGAQGPRKQKGAQEMRNPTVKAAEQTLRRKEILNCYLLSLCCLPCAVNETGPCGENTV